ncbi:MAG: hypothetical protein M0P54_11000 [Bacteroidales bacterium]|nr:hypothetical protein [Bacteroidales bacterium]MDD3701843.1 hypothetical protein [Bacteroidales bacterium]MDY0370440.1 hypothetical protein [Bacteroidales bacterium]
MNKLILFPLIGLLMSFLTAYSQTEQLPLEPLSAHDRLMLSRIPELPMETTTMRRSLPAVVDNSLLPYMPALVSQSGLECGQSASIGIQFAYELNAKRFVPGNLLENQYATHFTYNFLNAGSDAGISYYETFEIIKRAGNPNALDYGGMASGGPSRWMSGYDLYYNAMKNRVENIYSIKTNTEEGIQKLKNWIYDHGTASIAGGMGSFYSQFTSPNATLPSGTPEAGKHVITHWGSSPNHAMAIVGYNDSIRWDYNGDGQYTNHIDINGDGVVDVRDWEIGGFKMVNTYGNTSYWGDQGYSYMMYKTLADNTNAGGIWNNQVVIAEVKQTYQPQLTAKIGITYPCRNKIKIMMGVSTNLNANEPEYVLQFPMFDFQGGCKPMQGNNGNEFIEIGLDLNPLLTYVAPNQQAKYFLIVAEDDASNTYTGMINSFALIDYSGSEPIIITSPESNVPLQNNTITYLSLTTSVNYKAIEIVTDEIPSFELYVEDQVQLEAHNGTEPYYWYLQHHYDTLQSTSNFPLVGDYQLSPTNNNDGIAAIELPFEFPFYGEKYSTIYAAVDGFILFEPSLVTWPFYIAGKSYLIQNKIIAPTLSKPFQINPNNGEGIWVEITGHSVAIRWKVSVNGQGGNSTVLMAAILHEDGRIEFHYGQHNAAYYIARFAGISAGDGVNHVILNDHEYFTPYPQQYVKFTPAQNQDGIQLRKDGLLSACISQHKPPTTVQVLVTDQNGISDQRQLSLPVHGLAMDYQIQSELENQVVYGQEFSLLIQLTNLNDTELDAGTFSLTSNDPYVTIQQGQVNLLPLPAGDSIQFSTFLISVHNDIPNRHAAEFELLFNNGTQSYSRTIQVEALAPVIELPHISINDEENGILEPGESAKLVLEVLNSGGARLENIEAAISTTNPDITLFTDQLDVLKIEPDKSWNAIFPLYFNANATPIQIVDFELDITADYGFHYQQTIRILTSVIVENFETADFSLFPWTSSGSHPWFVTIQEPYEGNFAARSGPIGHSESSVLELEWEVSAMDTISFYYKVSSENNYDFLRFYINGQIQDSWSGNKAWTKASYPVNLGPALFTWKYEKDYSVSTGTDCAWIDYVVLPAKKIYTSIDEQQTELHWEFDLFPNPVQTELFIRIRADRDMKSRLLIADQWGRILHTEEILLSKDVTQLIQKDLHSISSGSCVVMLQTPDGWITKTIIKPAP